MSSSNRPQFWLQVRKDYIFDNFDNLLNYMRQYSYSPLEENPDYDSTLQCMTELSEEIGDKILATPYYQPLELEYDFKLILRLFCATILSSNKAGITARKVILELVDLLMKSRSVVKIREDEMHKLIGITKCCLSGRNILSCGFSWSDITFMSPDVIIIKLSMMKFHDPQDNHPTYYIENRGLLMIPPTGLITLSAVNRNFFEKNTMDEQFRLADILSVPVPEKEYEKAGDFEHLYKLSTRLISAQDQMRPSPKEVLKEYDDYDRMYVKVIKKRGLRVDVETVDPEYKCIRGKLLMNMGEKRPAEKILKESIEEGDYLMVTFASDSEYVFETADAFEYYYRNYVSECAAHKKLVIYSGRYKQGTEWISSDGIRLGVDNVKYESLTPEQVALFDSARETGMPIEVQLYTRPPRMDGPVFNVYADPFVMDPMKMETVEPFTVADADAYMIDDYLAYCKSKSTEIIADFKSRSAVAADPDECGVLLSLIAHVLATGLSTSRSRLEYVTALSMLSKILGREQEFKYSEHERRYLYSVIQFAQDHEPTAIDHEPELDGAGNVSRREQIVAALKRYKKKRVTKASPEIESILEEDVEEDVLDKVSALVSASNNLIDIIDDLELNNIKQVIARTLRVDDEYVSILDDRTYYGVESISLEFKTSVVYPPANRRRTASLVTDPDMQKWAIIKAVCGFLNSRSGGELIIGVNDAGYAEGVEDDMRQLVKLHRMSTADIDHYRTYLQYILDYAFKEPNPKVLTTDIARTCIDYLPEVNAEGKTILRIKIKPYKANVVDLVATVSERPKGIDDCYVRLSGRTVPVSNAMRNEILKYKN